mmetsp:Transcript_113283/g.178186  ORF Transcript_113283/g.178186 Transcript_113283/m.178186 type:complete len:98 (+) Transcript_113283:44-337(+)
MRSSHHACAQKKCVQDSDVVLQSIYLVIKRLYNALYTVVVDPIQGDQACPNDAKKTAAGKLRIIGFGIAAVSQARVGYILALPTETYTCVQLPLAFS